MPAILVPTVELRYVIKRVFNLEQPQRVLQQHWIPEEGHVYPPAEWRDVPLVEEKTDGRP